MNEAHNHISGRSISLAYALWQTRTHKHQKQARSVGKPPADQWHSLLAAAHPAAPPRVVTQALHLDRALEALGCGGGGREVAGPRATSASASSPPASSASSGGAAAKSQSTESLPLSGHKVLHFPASAPEDVAAAAAAFPRESSASVLAASYPHTLFGLDGGRSDGGYAQEVVLAAALDRFGFGPQLTPPPHPISSVEASAPAAGIGKAPLSSPPADPGAKPSAAPPPHPHPASRYRVGSVGLAAGHRRVTVEFVEPSGGGPPVRLTAAAGPGFGPAAGPSSMLAGPGGEFGAALAGLLRSHALGRDLCIVGTKGDGKSALAREFGRLLGYCGPGGTELVCCYRDMSPRVSIVVSCSRLLFLPPSLSSRAKT